MKGKYFLKVYNKRVSFEIEICRSVTIIRGDSATGKSTFINMLSDSLAGGERGVKLQTDFDRDRITVINAARQIDDQIALNRRDMLFVADEGINLGSHKAFVKYLQDSGSYLIYINRKNGTGFLQFAVSEIYTFKNERRDNYTAVKMFRKYIEEPRVYKPDLIITEDSNSGHDIIEHIVNVPVMTSNGKDNMANKIAELKNIKSPNIYVLVDCAAFGNCIEKVLRQGVHVNMSESIEYLLQDLCKKYPGCAYDKEGWARLNDTFKSERFLSDISAQLTDLDETVKI